MSEDRIVPDNEDPFGVIDEGNINEDTNEHTEDKNQ